MFQITRWTSRALKTSKEIVTKNAISQQNLLHAREEYDVINFHAYTDQLTDRMIMMAGHQ